MFSIHNHTEYSNASRGFLDSSNKLKDLIKEAKNIGLSGVAITDHECLSGHYKAQQLGKSLDFPVVLGNEIYLQTPEEYEEAKLNYQSGITNYPHFILLALDEIGHEQLRRLSSRAWYRSYTGGGIVRTPTLTTDIEEIIGSNKGHVVASTACLGGTLGRLVLQLINEMNTTKNVDIINNIKWEIVDFLKWCQENFGENNFYIEIQPATEEQIEQREFNIQAINIAKSMNIKFVVATDSHYLNRNQASIHRALLNNKDVEREVDSFYRTAYLMNQEELRDYLENNLDKDDIDTAIFNTMDILSKVKDYNLHRGQIVPVITPPKFHIRHLFKDYYDKYEYIEKFAYADREQDRYLLYQIENAIQKRINVNEWDTYLDRINKEFKEVYLITEEIKEPLSGYYNTMGKIIDLVWTEGDSFVCPGRGSSGAFLICYLLDITQTDPVPLGDLMPHWRHVSSERGHDLPDIDFDTESAKRSKILQVMKDFFNEDKVLPVCTFGTLSAKTAIQVAGKGLGYSNDDMEYLSSMIKVERGEVFSLHDMIEGDEEKERKPVKEFINELKRFPNLKETALGIEGLIVQRGQHASGVLITNSPYTEINCAMRTPRGELVSQFDLGDSEAMGGLKYDFLTTKCQDLLRVTMDLLLDDNVLQWQGTLKDTYNAYLHPDVLDYDNQEMWVLAPKVPSLFQFETMMGSQALEKVRPKSVIDMTVANSLMRLMADSNGQTPLDLYVRYKNDINEWYKDMREYGLNEDEIKVLEIYLLDSYGLADSQEKVMLISMDNKVAGFTLKESNKLRKAIAKKKAKILEEAKTMFFEGGKRTGARAVFLNYVWYEVFAKSFGYSFSSIHSYNYSVCGLQEMNLYYKYNPLYWYTSVLTINSASDEENQNNKATDYGKVASAIGKLQQKGVEVSLPSINHSKYGFFPDIKNNRILYGLRAINGVGEDIAHEIINNRPYKSFADFMDRMVLGENSVVKQSNLIQLIKAGCFDEFDDRVKIMIQFIKFINPDKKSLNFQNMNSVINLGIIPEDMAIYIRYFNYKKYITQKQFVYKTIEKPKDRYLLLDDISGYFFNEHFDDKAIIDYVDNRLLISEKAFKKDYDCKMEVVKEWFKKPETIEIYNKMTFMQKWNETCSGSISKWEMDSVCYYSHEHELANVNNEQYGIVDFYSMPEIPKIVGYKKWRGREIPQYDIVRIAGTVLDKDKNKHLLTLLTPSGVVNVKFNNGLFSFYDKQLSEQNPDGTKTVLEKTWFSRGNLMMITGYRKENQFRAYKYTNSVYQHTLGLIQEVKEDGSIIMQTERININE